MRNTCVTKSIMRDPITFEVVKNALLSLADEMAITVVRTAHSQVVRDAMDFSTAVCDAKGQVVTQGCGVPLHLGSFPDAMEAVIAKYQGNILPEDIFVLNDPYEGGMHLPDIFVIKPVFSQNGLIGYSMCVAHHQDIGGRIGGGCAVDSTEIFQEGLQIPLLKLYDHGRVNETLLAVWLRNVRVPDVVYGDIQAQIAACHVGEIGLVQLAERYTQDVLRDLMNEILEYTELRIRAEIAEMPDGWYDFEDHIDDDGRGSGPITIAVHLGVHGDSLTVDFDGTSPQVDSALNATMSFTKSAVYTAVSCVVSSDIPSNMGLYRPITVTAPEGTILNASRVAARNARGLTGYRAVEATLGALAQALPGKVSAAGDGGSMLAISGTFRDGRSFVFVDFPTGGWGARPDRDGIDGISPLAANVANVPIEEIELHQPVRVEQYGFLADTGGPGKWRGCLSVVRELRFLAEAGALQIVSDRSLFPPYGLAGGSSGSSSDNLLIRGLDIRSLPTKITIPIKRGDIVRHVLPGGGGYGNPLQREPELVLADFLECKVSVVHARQVYGVVIDERSDGVDHVETRSLRSTLRKGN